MKKLIIMLTILVAGMVQAQEFDFACPTDVEYDYTVGIAKLDGREFIYVSSLAELGDNLAWFHATANGDTPGFMVDGFQHNEDQHRIDNPIDLSQGAFLTQQSIRISPALHDPSNGFTSDYIHIEYTLIFKDAASTTATGTIRFE